MKSEKGITLTSLIVYVIGMVMVISIVSVLTTYFYKNIKNVEADIDPIAEYTKFNSYFTNEINKNNIKILDCANGEKQNYIAFDDGVQYTFVKSNEGIYQNEAKICRGITDCTFELAMENGNEIINVKITVGEKEFTNKYTLRK